MAKLTIPQTQEYGIVAPTSHQINTYLAKRDIYDAADKHGFADENNQPALHARINAQPEYIGVMRDGDNLLCSYVLPWNGKKDDEQQGRLYFVLTGKQRGSSMQWKLHRGRLITLTDGDKHVMTSRGRKSVLRQILSQR